MVFSEVLHPIKLEFRNVGFWGEGKPEKNLSEQIKQPTPNLIHIWPRHESGIEPGPNWWEAKS